MAARASTEATDKRWAVVQAELEDGGDVHVIPMFGRPHADRPDCWCLPTVTDDYRPTGGVRLFSHNLEN